MNIFALSDSPILSARYQHDKHVVKMTLETAQLVSQAVRLNESWRQCVPVGDIHKRLYKTTHAYHPCSVWARRSVANLSWLCQHGLALADEYSHRFWRTHKSRQIIEFVHDSVIPSLPSDGIGLTDFAQAMPDDCKDDDSVLAYRLYYVRHRIKPDSKWTNRRQDLPDWLLERALA